MQICDFNILVGCQQNLTVSDRKLQIMREFNGNLSHLFELRVLVIAIVRELLGEKSVS